LIDVDGAEFLDGISFLPTPGHSVDHASIRLRSHGQEALFTGDVMRHPLQIYRPDLRSVYCEFPEASRASRDWILAYASENNALCLTSHFAETSAGYVSRRAGGFNGNSFNLRCQNSEIFIVLVLVVVLVLAMSVAVFAIRSRNQKVARRIISSVRATPNIEDEDDDEYEDEVPISNSCATLTDQNCV
jgi:hypothetical protein